MGFKDIIIMLKSVVMIIVSDKCLQQFKTPCSSMHNSPCDQTSRWRAESIPVPCNGGISQEVDGCFEAHLLEGRTVGLHPNTVEWLILSIICHVICYQ